MLPPILTRDLLREHNDDILNGRPAMLTTSGSTTVPVRLGFSPSRIHAERRQEARVLDMLGGRIPLAEMVLEQTGRYAPNQLPVMASVGEQIRFLSEMRKQRAIQGFNTYATNAKSLASYFLERGRPQSWVKRLGIFSETLHEADEALVARAFPKALIWSTYSAKECGLIALRCLDQGEGWHVLDGILGIEILDNQGTPCSPGQVGRVVVTDYLNSYCPLIRYDIGDLASPGVCPCGGYSGKAFTALYGKVREAFLMPDGSRKLTYDLTLQFRTLSALHQFQVVQRSVRHFEILYRGEPGLGSTLEARFVSFLGYTPASIEVRRVNSIPRRANGKFFITWSEV